MVLKQSLIRFYLQQFNRNFIAAIKIKEYDHNHTHAHIHACTSPHAKSRSLTPQSHKSILALQLPLASHPNLTRPDSHSNSHSLPLTPPHAHSHIPTHSLKPAIRNLTFSFTLQIPRHHSPNLTFSLSQRRGLLLTISQLSLSHSHAPAFTLQLS